METIARLYVDGFPLENDRLALVSPADSGRNVFCCMPDVEQIRFSRGQFQAASEPNGLAACEAYQHEQSAAQKLALRHASLLFYVASTSMAVWSRSLSFFVRLSLLEFRTPFAVWPLLSGIFRWLSSSLRNGTRRKGLKYLEHLEAHLNETWRCSQPVSLLFAFSLPRNSSWLLSRLLVKNVVVLDVLTGLLKEKLKSRKLTTFLCSQTSTRWRLKGYL